MKPKKPYNSQDRHYKDPALTKVAHNVSMTDDQYDNLKAGAKLAGLPMGDFIGLISRCYAAYGVTCGTICSNNETK